MSEREIIYILCSIVALTGLFLVYYIPSPFGRHGPLKLFRNTYETFTKKNKNDKIL